MSMLLFSRVAFLSRFNFFVLHYFLVALFSCSTSFSLHSFYVALFRIALLSCFAIVSLFMFSSCYTFCMLLTLFMSCYFQVALLCVCVCLRPSTLKVSSVWGWKSRVQINDVVLKTLFSSAKFLH